MAASKRGGMWSLISEIDHTKTTWAMKVRVIRVYEVAAHARGGSTLEMVLHDEEGTRIHAIVKRPQVALFRPQLMEDNVYAMKNFMVLDNYQLYKTTTHPYLLEFVSRTKVVHLDIEFPSFMYDLQPFEMLQAQRLLNDKLLIDVIGKVVGRCAPQTHVINNRTERLMELTLEDFDGNRIGCTLWNNYITEFNDYVNQAQNEAIFMIVQLCRAKRYKGNVSVSTSFDVTKLIINEDRNEFHEFRNMFNEQAEETGTLTFLGPQPHNNGHDDILGGNVTLTSVSELLEKSEEGIYWVLAEIVSIDSFREWCYLGCTSCNKKVVPEDNRFRCASCNVTLAEGVLRYKVSICVMDDIGHASFTLWDRECSEILGKSAAMLRREVVEKTGDPNHFPEEIEAVIEKKGLFKVQVKNKPEGSSYKGTSSFGVLSMFRDPAILAMYKNKEAETVDLEDLEEKEMSGSVNNTELDATTKEGESDGKAKVDEGAHEDTPQASNKTVMISLDDSMKRKLEDEFSATKNGRRLRVKVKKERD